MRRAAGTLFAALAIAATVVATTAQAGSTTIHLNQSRRIFLHGAAANIIISDPAVADVSVLDAHSIILLGKGYGATSILVTDRGGHTLLNEEILVSAPDGGVVTLHRGVAVVDYSCLPRCQMLAPPKDGAGAPAAGGPAAPPQANVAPTGG